MPRTRSKAGIRKGMAVRKAWDGVFTLPVKERVGKPRAIGWTMVMDKGLGVNQTADLMAAAADAIDVVKLTFGTSAFFDAPLLKRKVRLITAAGCSCMPGGTFQEVCVWQGTFDRYLARAEALGFNAIEISDGTIAMDARTRETVIRRAVRAGFRVITEVGKKDPGEALTMRRLAEEAERDLALGAFMVLVEAREAGRGVGVMDAHGTPLDAEIDALVAGVKEPACLIWEAPLAAQQRHFILRFGPNVSLGNVAPEDVLALEALRCGLRGDTLRRAWRADPDFRRR